MSIRRTATFSSLFIFAAVVAGCNRVDTLSVTDNPDHTAVIVDAMVGNDRIVCVLPDVTKPCSKGTSQVVVSGVGTPADIDATWTAPQSVSITVASGNLTKSATTALSGRVRITYR
jgi:hypothetical protein